MVKHPFHASTYFFSVLSGISSHEQVFFHGKVDKDAPSLRHHGNSFLHNAMGRPVLNLSPAKKNFALASFHQSTDRSENRTLSSPVRSDEGDDPSFGDTEGDPFERMDATIKNAQI
jgi:hypothetical protein